MNLGGDRFDKTGTDYYIITAGDYKSLTAVHTKTKIRKKEEEDKMPDPLLCLTAVYIKTIPFVVDVDLCCVGRKMHRMI